MQLNIKNPEVVALAEEVANLTGESKTQAIRRALEERCARLRAARTDGQRRGEDLLSWLQAEVWPQVPACEHGKTLTRAEESAILGYGEAGA